MHISVRIRNILQGASRDMVFQFTKTFGMKMKTSFFLNCQFHKQLADMKTICSLIAAFILILTSSCTHEYHVSTRGDDQNKGSSEHPFRTISQAAQLVRPGDRVIVHEGIYREQVNPLFGGDSDSKRIVYRAADGEHVEIKGSEVVQGWESLGNGVWKVVLSNSLFGDHNLIAGEVILRKVLDRSTPYHPPHSTSIAGLSNTTLGDDRFYNNLFLAPGDSTVSEQWIGLNAYNHVDYEFPVHISHNVYVDGSMPFEGEEGSLISNARPTGWKLEEEEGRLYLHLSINPEEWKMKRPIITTELLGKAVRTGQAWENPDGSPLQIDTDFFGNVRNNNPTPGPFEEPGSGELRLLLWEEK